MDRRAALARLRDREDELRRLGVERLYLFGSTARDAARPDSDVDLFFDARAGLGWDVVTVIDRVREILGCRADVMTRGSIHKRIRTGVEASAIQVF
jgi:hypothetical protein